MDGQGLRRTLLETFLIAWIRQNRGWAIDFTEPISAGNKSVGTLAITMRFLC